MFKNFLKHFLVFVCAVLIFPFGILSTASARLSREAVPEPLKPWMDWVLKDKQHAFCPIESDGISVGSSASESDFLREDTLCEWSTPLLLTLDQKGGSFSQKWFSNIGGWAPLPGDQEHWPQMVKATSMDAANSNAEQKPIPVILNNGRPSVFLPANTEWLIVGNFEWKELPDFLQIPKETTLLKLQIESKEVEFPQRTEEGSLSLKIEKNAAEENESDSSEIKIYRKVTDHIPLELTTQISLKISGKPRELLFGPIVPENFIPLSVSDQLPLRFEKNGWIKIQVKAGTWTIEFKHRQESPRLEIEVPAILIQNGNEEKIENSEEIWVFEPNSTMRRAEIDASVESIDARQTLIPENWKRFTAYRLEPNQKFKIIEKERGQMSAKEDRFTLSREIWFDFSGIGYSVADEINGISQKSSRFEIEKPFELGRIRVLTDQLITKLSNGLAGIDLPAGSHRLKSEMRVEGNKNLMSLGWNRDFDKASLRLHLPFRFRLLTVTGVDQSSGTLLERFSVFSCLVTLFLVIGFTKLLGLRFGIIAFLGFVLGKAIGLSDEFWIFVLLVFLFARLFKRPSIFKSILSGVQVLTLFGLLLNWLPFGIHEMQKIANPAEDTVQASSFQLIDFLEGLVGFSSYKKESVFDQASTPKTEAQNVKVKFADLGSGLDTPTPKTVEDRAGLAEVTDESLLGGAGRIEGKADVQNPPIALAPQEERPEPISTISKKMANKRSPDNALIGAKIQTGSGMPEWAGNIVELGFNGKVGREKELRLYWVSPFILNLITVLSFLCLLALFLKLLSVFLSSNHHKIDRTQLPLDSAKTESQNPPHLVAGLNAVSGFLRTFSHNVFYSKKTFGLLLMLLFSFLPAFWFEKSAKAQSFPPSDMLEVLKQRLIELPECEFQCANIAKAHLEVSGSILRMRLEVHAEELSRIPLPSSEQWNLTEILIDGQEKPVLGRLGEDLWLQVSKGIHTVLIQGTISDAPSISLHFPMTPYFGKVDAAGWRVLGLSEDGSVDENLELIRAIREGEHHPNVQNAAEIPPFLLVQRSIDFKIDWNVETTVSRLSKSDVPITIEIPLLEHESITSEGLKVENGKVLVSLSPNENAKSWTSVLQKTNKLTLKAEDKSSWVELWRIDHSSLWHLVPTGIPSVSTNANGGTEWRPFPGEKLEILLDRPEAVPGLTKVIDESKLSMNVYSDQIEFTLAFILRQSIGGIHSVLLPEGAKVENLSLHRMEHPFVTKDNRVEFETSPGKQIVEIKWRQKLEPGFFFQVPKIDIGVSGVNHETSIFFDKLRTVVWTGGISSSNKAFPFWIHLLWMLPFAIFIGRSQMKRLFLLKGSEWFLIAIPVFIFKEHFTLAFSILSVWTAFMLLLGWKRERDQKRVGPLRFKDYALQFFLLISMILILGLLLIQIFEMLRFGIATDLLKQNLSFYADRTQALLPTVWAFSLPLWLLQLIGAAWLVLFVLMLPKIFKRVWQAFDWKYYFKRPL